MSSPGKKLDFSAFDLRKFDLTRKYDNDFSAADGIAWRDHVLLYAISFLLFLFLIWANFATLDETVRGEGRIIPSNAVQVIQNLEGGIVEDLLVKEGDTVEAGQPLVRLSNIQAASDVEASSKRYYGLLTAIIRLQAEADGATPQFPDDVARAAPESVAAERAAFEANQRQMENQVSVLQEQQTQKQQEITELEKRIANNTNILKLAVQERNMVAPMVARGSSSKKELLQLEREIAQQQAELDGYKLSLPRVIAAAKEAEERIAQQKSSFRAEAQRQLSERTAELGALKETLVALRDKSARTVIMSPVHGTVKDVKIKTAGGVVKPGEPIMEVVPLEDQLIVEGHIRPADIAFIYPGQKAIVRLSAYDFSIYGSLEGKVVDISPDSFMTERGESFYRVKVRTGETKLKKGDKELVIIPGMQATLDLITGQRTVMRYILKPFIKASKTAMTER